MPDAREDRFSTRSIEQDTRPHIISLRTSAYLITRRCGGCPGRDLRSRLAAVGRRAQRPRWSSVALRHGSLRPCEPRASASSTRRSHNSAGSRARGLPQWIESTDEDRLAMQSSLGSLSTDERELLMLAGWEGLSASEIGRVLRCSPTAARIRLHRARTRLKLAMAEAASTQKHAAVSRHERVTDVESNGTPQEVFRPHEANRCLFTARSGRWIGGGACLIESSLRGSALGHHGDAV